jgi:hypothetical protein
MAWAFNWFFYFNFFLWKSVSNLRKKYITSQSRWQGWVRSWGWEPISTKTKQIPKTKNRVPIPSRAKLLPNKILPNFSTFIIKKKDQTAPNHHNMNGIMSSNIADFNHIKFLINEDEYPANIP